MTERRCDQCRHWQQDTDEWEAERVGFRRCMAVRERWRIQEGAGKDIDRWENEKSEEQWLRAQDEALKSAKAYVQDGSEYKADLMTGPDFFCALFAAN